MILREINESDLPTIFEHESDAEACRMAAYPVRDWETFLRHWREKILAHSGATKKIIVFNDEVVGNIVSWENDRQRFVGYWIGKQYWGRGFATMALREFLAEIEKERPLFAYVATRNPRSFRVLEKCGFTRLGDATIGPDGVEEILFQLQL